MVKQKVLWNCKTKHESVKSNLMAKRTELKRGTKSATRDHIDSNVLKPQKSSHASSIACKYKT
ncbi:hypothetical protein T12_16750 [Trichinella patagoniensis]|uniref:Uncharacterized protein n=1 Tax=Trichinella patagoniensis TaxID=990121 RepID=A0A0V1A1X3_9BILA|nr:hypothetical protein T12_16750 [Trichinella patagoniensis]